MAILKSSTSFVAQLGSKIADPFNKTIPAPNYTKDFSELVITEIVDGKLQDAEQIRLVGSWLPFQPFEYGGKQRFVKNYYPGNSEPTFHILGPEEDDLTIRGRLKDKIRGYNNSDTSQPYNRKLRGVSLEMQQLIEAMRIRGNIVRIKMGEFLRYGVISEAQFKLKTIVDIDYSITFSISGFNQPLDCNQVDQDDTIPFDINKKLIAQAALLLEKDSQRPANIPQSFADIIDSVTSDVYGAISNFTSFIDDTISTAEDISASINKITALGQFASAQVSASRTRIGKINIVNFGGVNITDKYTIHAWNEEYIGTMNDLASVLAALRARFAGLVASTPLARHRVREGDTLQSISNKFYNTPENWEAIYDHNGLTSTDLETSTILEIPKV